MIQNGASLVVGVAAVLSMACTRAAPCPQGYYSDNGHCIHLDEPTSKYSRCIAADSNRTEVSDHGINVTEKIEAAKVASTTVVEVRNKYESSIQASSDRCVLLKISGDCFQLAVGNSSPAPIPTGCISSGAGASSDVADAASDVEAPKVVLQKPRIAAPDVTLRFVDPTSPALVLVNKSDVVARDIKWMVALWDMDLPDRDNPLPIPNSTADWIRPQQEGGPQALFLAPNVASLIKRGDHLVGSAVVSCADCVRGRTLVVYIVWQQGGWFSEIRDMTSGNLLIPKLLTKEGRAGYFETIVASVPAAASVPIEEGVWDDKGPRAKAAGH